MTSPDLPTPEDLGKPAPPRHLLVPNLMAALTTSFVVVALGAAFGVMSGRGAFAGMISAAIIGIVVASVGGTRIAVSGPTGPMTTVTAIAVAFAYDEGAKRFPELPPEQFVSIILLCTSALVMLFALLRLSRLIHYVPQVVISGFMNGIAILIWIDVAKKYTGTPDKPALTGNMGLNVALGVAALLISWRAGPYLKRLTGRWSAVFPATLVAIILVTGVSVVAGMDVQRTTLAGIKGAADLWNMVTAFVPRSFPTTEILLAALPMAFSLAMLNLLDTLLTALVMDKLTGDRSALNRELFGQSLAIAAVVPFGGIPGAQATIRSVLLFKEGATARWTGMLAGGLALVQVLMLQDGIAWIPQAVFMGVLVKVGLDVFDWLPLRIYLARLRRAPAPVEAGEITLSHLELAIIAGTTIITVVFDLNVAVFTFTAVFYVLTRGLKVKLMDLTPPPAPPVEVAGPPPGVDELGAEGASDASPGDASPGDASVEDRELRRA